MSSVFDQDELRAQLHATQQLLSQLDDQEGVNAWMLQARIQEIEEQLNELEGQLWRAKTALLFEQNPLGVEGGAGGRVLSLYMDVVAKAAANVGDRDLKPTGSLRKHDSELIVTQILKSPTGFEGLSGFELQEPAGQLAKSPTYQAVQRTTELLHAASVSEESALDDLIDGEHLRVLDSIKKLLGAVNNKGQSISLVSNEKRASISQNLVGKAIEKVSVDAVEETRITRFGVFKGATLNTKRFDFDIESEEEDDFDSGEYSGNIYKGVGVASIAMWNQDLLNKECQATFQLKTVRGNTTRRYFTLVGVISKAQALASAGKEDPPSPWPDPKPLDDLDDVDDSEPDIE